MGSLRLSKALRHLFHLEINSLPQLQPVKKVKWELTEKSLPLLYQCAAEKSMALVLLTSHHRIKCLMLQKVHSCMAWEPLSANIIICAETFCWASHVWVFLLRRTRQRDSMRFYLLAQWQWGCFSLVRLPSRIQVGWCTLCPQGKHLLTGWHFSAWCVDGQD